MNSKTKVISNSILYTASNLLLKGLNFILLPLYTYSMSSAEFGVINLVSSFRYIMSFIIAFSLYSAVTRFYADIKHDKNSIKIYNGTLIIFIFFSATIFFVLSLLWKDIIVNTFFEGVPFFPIIFIVMFFLIFHTQHTLHQNILQAMQKGKKLTVINIVFAVFQTCLLAVLVGFFKLGALGYVTALLIVNIVYFIYMIVDLKREDLLSFNFDFLKLKESLKYSIPLMPHDLSGQVSTFVSRVLINNSGSLASVGLYSVASQFGVLVDSFQFSVNRAFTPWFFNHMNSSIRDGNKEANQLSSLLLQAYSFIYLIVGLFSQEVILLMTPSSYSNAWKIIPIIVLGYAIKSIYYFLLNTLMYYKSASRKIFVATLTGSLVEVILSAILIPEYGMYGAAFSFAISKIIMVSIMIVISRFYVNIFNIPKMILIITPGIISTFIGLVFSYTKYDTEFNGYNFLYKMIILIIYMFYIYIRNKERINVYIIAIQKKYFLKLK